MYLEQILHRQPHVQLAAGNTNSNMFSESFHILQNEENDFV